MAAISSADAYWWHVSLFDTAVVTDPSQEGVRVRRFAHDQMIELGRRGSAVLWRLHKEGAQAAGEWRRRLPELSSRETWDRLFGTR